MREHAYYCEGPGCDSHIRSVYAPPREGWLLVIEGCEGGPRDFCGWECAMRFAAGLPPHEIVSLPGGWQEGGTDGE